MIKKKASRVSAQEAKTPEHQAIYQRLRDMILFGEVEPGQPVTIMGLRARIDAGMTPVREAIRRLTAEGALVATENRRVAVPAVNSKQLEQIAFARLSHRTGIGPTRCGKGGFRADRPAFAPLTPRSTPPSIAAIFMAI